MMDQSPLLMVAGLALLCCASAQEHQMFFSSNNNLTSLPRIERSHLVLNDHSCDWPLCNFNDTEQTVVVPEGFSIPEFDLELHNPKAVHLYPSCVLEIKIFNGGLVTTFPGEGTGYPPHSTCKVSLRLTESRAEMISHGVSRLLLFNSTVDTVNLMDQEFFYASGSSITLVENLHWKRHISKTVDTKVSEVSQITADSDWSISGSSFGLIHKNGIIFNGDIMAVSDTSVANVKSQGIKITRGHVAFVNVSFGNLEALALVAEDPVEYVEFTNVAIISAVPHCIVLQDRERLFLKDVTVGGKEVDSSSPYFKFEDDFIVPENASKIFVQKNLPQCSSSSLTLSCDFADVDKIVEVNSSYVSGFQVLQIKNAKSLLVLSTTCNVELELKSVNGSLPQFATESGPTSTDGQPVDDCGMSLSVLDSHLDIIHSKYISNLSIVNSSITRLHGGTLGNLTLQNVILAELDNIVLNGEEPLVWRDVKIQELMNLTIQTPLEVQKLRSGSLHKGAVTIDHGSNTTFIDLRLFGMDEESLLVKRGNLLLKGGHAFMVRAGAIYLEKGAAIEIDDVTTSIPSVHIISATDYSQVTFHQEFVDATTMVRLRLPTSLPDPNSNFTISFLHHSPYCSWDFLMPLECDFSPVTNATVNIDLENDQEQDVANIQGASFLTIYPSCIEKLKISKVEKATTASGVKNCSTWLEAQGVHFFNITTGVIDVTLTSCNVDFLSPDRMLRDLDLEDTQVKRIVGVQWKGFTGRIVGSHIGTVVGLVASSDMYMVNSTVEEIHPLGMTLTSGGAIINTVIHDIASRGFTVKGELHMRNISIDNVAENAIIVENEGNITNSVISNIGRRGITVEGFLHIKDVVITNLSEKAIVVKGGILILSNVIIKSSSENGIVTEQNGAIAVQNVMVGEKKMQIEYHFDGNRKPDPTPDGRESNPESSSVAGKDCNSWKWATAFFIVILLVAIAAVVGTFIRYRNGRVTPRVSWRGNSDVHDVLIENEEDGTPRGSEYLPIS